MNEQRAKAKKLIIESMMNIERDRGEAAAYDIRSAWGELRKNLDAEASAVLLIALIKESSMEIGMRHRVENSQ